MALALADIVEAEAEAEAEAGAKTRPGAAAWDEAEEEARGGGDRAEEGGRELMSGILERVVEWWLPKRGPSSWF